MKQLIVLISTIVLGIAVALMIMGFKTDARSMTEAVSDHLTTIENSVSADTAIH